MGRSDEVAITITRTFLPSGRLTAFLIAGAITGLLGVVLFGVAHAATIVPIWTRLLVGIPFSVGAGVVIGWAFYELRESTRLKAGLIGAVVFGVLLWATLIPMTLFGVIVRATGIHGTDDTWEVVVESLLAFGAGAVAGRLISGRWRATLALGAASLALTLAQAGPIPVMNSRRAASLFAALAVVYLFCVIALGLLASVISKFLRWPAQQIVGRERR